MKNVYYIFDASRAHLVICQTQIGMVTDEEQLIAIAENRALKWSDCSWGGVRHLEIDLDADLVVS